MKIRALISAGTAVSVCAALAVAVVAPHSAQAAWPDKPVRVIVPFGTGGGTDIQARLLADKLGQLGGQRFLVENRSGAGGLIGAQLVVESPPDGHTLLFTTATLAINTTLYSKTLKFNTQTDLVPSTQVSTAPNVLCVHPSVPAKSAKELVALAKSRPGVLNAGGNTPGSTSHLASEMLSQLAGLKMTIITFTGGGPAVISLMTGDIDLLFATGPVASAGIKTGRIRCLAVTTDEPNPGLPGLPPINTVVPGLEIANWYSMFFPKGTPSEAVNGLSKFVKEALSDEKIRGFMEREAIVPVGGTPDQLGKLLANDIKKYRDLIEVRKIPIR
ncbi:MAG: tripartite tricarboxylate transporter substrate-binding protein [Betaproteobacteria bacterium]|nr:tripartite tricarboxylate transporter substrate-binding protein [Betaproteobacteria bacterium]